MRPYYLSLWFVTLLMLVLTLVVVQCTFANPFPTEVRMVGEKTAEAILGSSESDSSINAIAAIPLESGKLSRTQVLVASFTVFVLSVFVGFEIIAKVPPTLHTPLMSGSNAISGITVVGAMIAAGYKEIGVGSLLGLVAVVLAMINVVGGFVVTHRMLLMFKKR